MSNLNKVEDPRGMFEELVKHPEHGQVSLFTIKPQQTRGEHYHKLTLEIFLVIKGNCIYNNEEKLYIGDSVMPKIGEKHSFSNPFNKTCKILIWRPDHFDSNSPDTYYEK